MEATHGFTGGLSLDDALEWEEGRVDDDEDVARPGRWELASLITLVVAGTGLPLIGWLVGIGMVHLSDVWTDRDKTIATLVPAAVVGLCVIASAAVGSSGPMLLDLGPLAFFLFFGGAIAGLLGAAYLTWRAFQLA